MRAIFEPVPVGAGAKENGMWKIEVNAEGIG